jgi:hypothetical protein
METRRDPKVAGLVADLLTLDSSTRGELSAEEVLVRMQVILT